MSDLHLAKSFLRQCNQRSLQSGWFAYPSETASEPLEDAPLPLNDRGHIAWEKGRSVLWLGQDLILPETWTGYPLLGLTAKLALMWWAEEAIVFVNGQPVQGGDLFDCSVRIVLTDRVKGGELFRIRVRLVSPGHDPGALVKSQLELEDLRQGSSLPEPSWLAEELAIVEAYLQSQAQSQSQCPEESSQLEQYCQPLLEQINLGQIHQSWENLEGTVAKMRDCWVQAWGGAIRRRRIHLLGHAHLDLAWLWPVAETWAAAERTFRSVLALQKEFPELIFAHSSPVLYHWLEQNRPDLFQEIYAAMQRGQWETIAGMWVEPDTILPSGESLVRQVFYGQQYVQDRLGQRNRVAWLPDSFGFSSQLPQILKQGGIDWFITQKLTWNDTNVFPHSLFQWQSPDGTIALALMSAPIGKGLEPLAMMEGALAWEQATGLQDYLWLPGVGDHGGGPSRDMLETARRWQGSPCFPQLGFSPLHDYLERLEPHLDRSVLPLWREDLYLELHRGCYTSHSDQKQWNRHLEDLLYRAELWATWAQILADQPFPHGELEQAWKFVLFNQFHDILPGSSIPEVFEQANQEWQQAKDLAEGVLSRSLHTLSDGITPSSPLGEYSTIVVFNSIPQGLVVSGERLVVSGEGLVASGEGVRQPAILQLNQLIHSKLKTQNSKLNPIQAWDSHGQTLPTQSLVNEDLLVLLPERSGVGYTQIHLRAAAIDDSRINDLGINDLGTNNSDLTAQENPSHQKNPETAQSLEYPVKLEITPHHYILENRYLRVTIDRATGEIAQLYSSLLNRNIFKAPGNQIQVFRDRGQYWDAWNIDPNYEQYPLSPPQLLTCEVVDQGALRCSVRVRYRFQQATSGESPLDPATSDQLTSAESTLEQIYYLDYNALWLNIETRVNWWADQVLLKVAFPFALEDSTKSLESSTKNLTNPLAKSLNNLNNLKLVTESACGVVERSTRPTNGREAAQWEIPIHRWLDLSTATPEKTWGISVINTGLYGADVKGACVRLSLLRSPRWPDPHSDRGVHRFTYALYPHAGGWETAQTVTLAHWLNSPLTVLPLSLQALPQKTLPPEATLLRFGSANLHLMSFHPQQEGQNRQNRYVLRCYESAGETTPLALHFSDRVDWDGTIVPLTGLEAINDRLGGDQGCNEFTIQPWQIHSGLVKLESRTFHVAPKDLVDQ